ncbi:Hpt domain-containing protein [Arthrobacter sp. MDT2-2]
MVLPNVAPMVLPLVDLAVLSQLERQLNDPVPARAFARDYITGFETRYLRLTSSIGTVDLPAALDAALSLRNSSAMVGAARLSAMAADLETAVTSADLETARATLPEIERCGLDTINELEVRYLAST